MTITYNKIKRKEITFDYNSYKNLRINDRYIEETTLEIILKNRKIFNRNNNVSKFLQNEKK